MRIRAPAKINLSLRVVGRGRDGYHLVDTVMIPVNLYDEIEITRPKKARQPLSVTCNHPLVPSGKKNLAYRAAALLLKKAGIQAPIRIRIRKRIPVGAGLGGGSSDAAATLVGLNRLLRLGWERKRLLPLAGSLGADVPFFILGKPARGRGIGDKLSEIGPIRRLWLVILYPGFPVSTRWAYGRLARKLTKHIENTSINLSLRGRRVLAELSVNDLEKVVFQRYPRVARLKARLIQEGAAGALMSGSGSSVFGIFFSRRQATKALIHLRKEVGVQAYLVRSLN
ncbi:MAG: 4-(cytidine 5'-diphospho)-2-C-methyl-D-erythritol kinase [Deltaproteobacteria bacterium RIFCSPLOWO2_12_FULL_60_19]|nr:MAG: 4-(cytidine 5'-diphospho)-2-C-methyl-D-erythritol kinase [Deltaproteobacteria bacterium RIFCSPLOWO2_12_FULL_60_19]